MTPAGWARERAALTAVARGAAPADRYVRGGTLLNVHTGERYPANVAIRGERIAYVGDRDDMLGPRTEVVDATGRTLVPGYVEPHAHPWTLVTPAALARHVLPLGTTAIFADNLPLYWLGGVRGFEAAARALARGPLRYYWLVRPHGQSRGGGADGTRRFPLAAIARMLDQPWTAAAGEITRWPDVAAGRRPLLERLALAALRGKRIEGHTAGARLDRLAALAAAGVTSDHEPITAEEALERARLGIALMLRQSSLRPDLRALLGPFVARGLLGRLMLTTDGSTPAHIAAHGFVDDLVRLALAEGVPPVDAYRMVTLNPAAYFGKDADLGSIAPGRFADLLLLDDLAEPRPRVVLARGRVVARDGALTARVPEPPWRRVLPAGAALRATWRARPADFALPAGRLPVLRFASAVITALEERPAAPGDLVAALLDRRGRWVTATAAAGFGAGIDGLAASTSTDFNVLALGRHPEALARAVDRVLALGGGLVLVDGARIVFELPLPIGGLMSPRPLAEAAARERELKDLLAARGHPFHDPLFSLFFLTADFLPAARLTARGVWDVKRSRVLRPPRRR